MTDLEQYAGQSALVVTMEGIRPVVDRWRLQYDPFAQAVPPHVTVLFPFLPLSAIDASVHAELTTLFAAQPSFDAVLSACERFPEVLYLAPQPSTAFEALTHRVHRRWPEAPPYGGAFDTVIPHLTVAHSPDAEVHARLTGEIEPHLPLSASVTEVTLIGCEGPDWVEMGRFPLGSSARTH